MSKKKEPKTVTYHYYVTDNLKRVHKTRDNPKGKRGNYRICKGGKKIRKY